MTDLPDIAIADIQKNGRETVRIQLRSWKGTRNVDLRVYVNSKDAPAPIATKKAFTIKPALVGDLIEALRKAQEVARAEGLLS